MKDTMQKLHNSIQKRSRYRTVVMALAIIVVFVTTYLLILPAITLEQSEAERQGGIDVPSVTQTADTDNEAETPDNSEQTDMPADTETEDRSGSADTSTDADQTKSEDADQDADTDTGNSVDGASSQSADDQEDASGALDEENAEAEVSRGSYETDYLASDGNNYRITVTYGEDAGVPVGAELSVHEITSESKSDADAYEEYVRKTEEALGWEEGSAFYVRLFDIKIVDEDGQKVEIQAPVDVKIELDDKDKNNVVAANTQVVHFADDSDKGEVVSDVEVDGDTVSFEAEGFSAYAIVDGPEATDVKYVQDLEELANNTDKAFYLSYGAAPMYFTNSLNGKGCYVETNKYTSAAEWYFEPVEGTSNSYRIYTYVNDVKKYMKQESAGSNNISLADTGTVFELSKAASGKFYIKHSNESRWLQHSNGGGGIRFYTDKNNAANSQISFSYVSSYIIHDDPYGLDGETYGLMNWNGGVAGKALMSSSSTANSLDAKSLTVMSTTDNKEHLFVPNESEISMWSFQWIEEDKYYLTTVVDGSTKYLKIDSSGLSVVSEVDDNCKIQVVPGTGTHETELFLKSGNNTLTYSGNLNDGFIVGGSAGSEWLNLVKLSELTEEYFMTYSAQKVSVSDEEKVSNGSRVIVYTRSWNDEKKQYDFYAIGSDGKVIPVYESGDSIEWVSGQINKLLWNFVEYYWEGTTDPNYYYELYNQYSEKFLAPQVTDGQILSDDPLGINLNGRRDGKYYSTIMAWDESNYSFAGLKVENGQIVSCPKSEAMDFYFAIMEDVNVDDKLHSVDTVDHTQYGITMRIIDLDNAQNMQGRMNAFLGSNKGGIGTALDQGLLSSNLGADGYPVTTKTGGQSLGILYNGASEVNHLFIESTYNTSGYFEYDSTQNFASLNNGNNFTVYKELGTYDTSDSNRTTLKHGQFFPFNDLKAGTFASVNGKNLYSLTGQLPDSDPRKYENLYNIEHDGKKVDYYFGVDLEASFTQTPDGKDAWGHDIIFEFTGDDDFWLYVDGELIIDLGGLHSAVPGSVNFRTGMVNINGTQKNLRQIFEDNYRSRNPSATQAQVETFLAEYFDEGSNVFRENTTHNMRIFYMERGAGASNLQMRFNLAAVKQGNVQLSKEISGVDDSGSIMAEYPYQIYYKTSDDEGAQEFRLSNKVPQSEIHTKDYVFYKDSVKPVKYAEEKDIGGTTYEDVFFLKPGETADINFPEGMTSYRIVECGVNTDVYSKVTVNNTPIPGTDPGGSSGAGNYKDFGIGYAATDARTKVNYVNEVNPDALKNLTIKKKLYEEDGVTPIRYENNKTPFKFRLYMSSEFEEPSEANMHTYHVKDSDGYYCRWNSAEQKFEKIGEGITDYSALTEEEKVAASFTTSVYGQISKIPTDHTVEIRNVLAGTKFRVEERPDEIPDGYSFQKYEYNGSDYRADDDQLAPASPGVEEAVTAQSDSDVSVCNIKGWGLRVNKVWSDADYMSEREPTYFAVFTIRNHSGGQEHLDLVEDTVRQLKYAADPQTLYWYFDMLESGKNLGDYVIREVRLTGNNWHVEEDGTVTNIHQGNVHPIHDGEEITLSGKQKGETEPSGFQYTVLYQTGSTTDDSNVRVDTTTNNRPGIELRKSKWNTAQPLAGATFTLTDTEGDLIGTFTSDEDGLITVAFLRDNVPYTLTETKAPQGYHGLETPMTIELNNGSVDIGGVAEDYYVLTEGSTPTLTIKDRTYSFTATKINGDTQQKLQGVHFALHKQVIVDGVITIDLNPMPGYEDLVTGSDGVIPGLDNTLPPGTYELREKTPYLDGYQPLAGYIGFTVSPVGDITLGYKPDGVTLTRTPPADSSDVPSGYDADGNISYDLIIRNYQGVNIVLKKVGVNNTEPSTETALSGATFTVYTTPTGSEVARDAEGNELRNLVSDSTAGKEGWFFSGKLSPGTYYLEETVVPDGYYPPLGRFVLTVNTPNASDPAPTIEPGWTTGGEPVGTVTADSAGGYTVTFRNVTGVSLPSSGGPGTKLFYLFGSILCIGCAVVLIARRRASR